MSQKLAGSKEKMAVKYYGTFTSAYGRDERAFDQPLEQLQIKLKGGAECFAVADVSFTSTAIVIETRDATQCLPINMMTFANRTKNASFFGLILRSADGKHFVCHLLGHYRGSVTTTMEFLADNIKRLLSGDS